MYAIICSTLLGLIVLLSLGLTNTANWIWSPVWGVLGFFVGQFGIGLIMKKKISGMMAEIQGILLQGQKQMQEKTNRWRTRPPGSAKQAQIEMEREQKIFITKALKQSECFEKFYKWSPLLKKQISTFQMQMNYQLKEWKTVDKLMPNCIFMDPMTISMKMARMYTLKDENIDKFFSKQTLKLRYGQGAIVYGLYAWIQVQRNDIEGAMTTLIKANSKMENECFKMNKEILANGKLKQFSLAGLGDEWYALGLEEPKIKMQRVHQRPY